jgi:hypothetical protein
VVTPAAPVSSSRIEPKVTAATAGTVLSAAVVWVLTTYVFRGALPAPVEGVVDVLVPGAVAFVSGWLAKHATR